MDNIGKAAESDPSYDIDRYQDVFIHDWSEIEEVWKQLSIATARTWNFHPPQAPSSVSSLLDTTLDKKNDTPNAYQQDQDQPDGDELAKKESDNIVGVHPHGTSSTPRTHITSDETTTSTLESNHVLKRRRRYPYNLSAIQLLVNSELQAMRDNDEGIYNRDGYNGGRKEETHDGSSDSEEEEDDGVAEGMEKEAGVMLSMVASLFTQHLMIKTMYHLPPSKSFGIPSHNPITLKSRNNSDKETKLNDKETIGKEETTTKEETIINENDTTANEEEEEVGLEISREDVRRALLREETFDFLVQSGLAQPDPPDPPVQSGPTQPVSSYPNLIRGDVSDSDVDEEDEEGDNTVDESKRQDDLQHRHNQADSHMVGHTSIPQHKNNNIGEIGVGEMDRRKKHVHMGYWKIAERTLMGLQPSSSQPSLQQPSQHIPEELAREIMMYLDPLKEESHGNYTLWPDFSDVLNNHIEFAFISHNSPTKSYPSTTSNPSTSSSQMVSVVGRIQLGHVNVLGLHGTITLDDLKEGKAFGFEWDDSNKSSNIDEIMSEGRGHEEAGVRGHGSAQFLSSSLARQLWSCSSSSNSSSVASSSNSSVVGEEIPIVQDRSWLNTSAWGVLSLDLKFELGDSGFILHTHYLCVPLFCPVLPSSPFLK